jgi:hypothetical protein
VLSCKIKRVVCERYVACVFLLLYLFLQFRLHEITKEEMQFADACSDDDSEEKEEEEEDEDELEDAVNEKDDWEEAAEECLSLFGEKMFSSVDAAMKFDGFDVETFGGLSVYDRIKVVNWCRTKKRIDFVLNKLEWESEVYLKPVVEDDPYLTWSSEFGEEREEEEPVELDESLKRELIETQEALEKTGVSIEELQK